MEPTKVTCDDVNQLVAMCSISQEKAITSLQQCSSSLFVLLYQRLYNCTIKDIESSPYTLQQKQWNVTRVLNELRGRRGIDVAGIDAEQIIQLNEEHISRLITLFLNIAYKMRLQGGGGGAGVASSAPSGSGRISLSAAQPRPVLAELPHGSAEDGTWYAPVRPVEEGEHVLQMYHTQAGGQFPQEHVKVSSSQVGGEEHTPYLQRPLAHQQLHSHSHHHHHQARGSHGGVDGVNAEGVADAATTDDDDDNPLVMESSARDEHDYGGSAGSYGDADDEEEEIPTNQLVNAWSAEVIPPKWCNNVVSTAGIADVRERLSLMEDRLIHAASQRKRLQRADAQPLLDSNHVGISRTDGRKIRDSKTHHQQRPKVTFPRSLVPDTVSTDEMLRQEPKRIIDYTLRNEKIEMLRSIRFIDDLQKEIRRTVVQQHNDATQQLREEVRQSLEKDKREKTERMRRIKNEDEKYRNAYKAIMAAACNDLRNARDLMAERTRQLADYHSLSLRESRRMCQYMKRESRERMRHDLLRYASTVTGWQSHFVS